MSEDIYKGYDAPKFAPPPKKRSDFKKKKKEKEIQEKIIQQKKEEATDQRKEQRDNPKYEEIHVRLSHKDYGEAIERRIYKTNSFDHKNDIIIKALAAKLNIDIQGRENRKPKKVSTNINVRSVPKDISDALSQLIKDQKNGDNLVGGYWIRDVVEEALEEYLAEELKEIRANIGRDGKKIPDKKQPD